MYFGPFLEIRIDEKMDEKINANLTRFWKQFELDLGSISGYFLMKCWCLCSMLRPYESIGPASKIKGRGLNWGMLLATKMHPKNDQKNQLIFWWILGGFGKLNGRFLVVKIFSKINVFLVGSLEGHVNIGRTARGAASGVLSAADPPWEPLFIKDYNITKKHNTICTLEIGKTAL